MTTGRFKILTIGNSFYFADAGKLIPKEANACEKWGCSPFGCKAHSPCPPLTITNYQLNVPCLKYLFKLQKSIFHYY